MLSSAITAPVTAADSSQITIQSFAFSPQDITVPIGTTVTWTNRDQEIHQVVSATKTFRSAALDTGDAFSYAFTAAGTFQYTCTLHPHMTGTVHVVAKP
ncbi:MAG: amicyanin [Rhodospirillaceae bacterium]|nr:MAG: amicyanin [Rhodospirillaceae bacterium]